MEFNYFWADWQLSIQRKTIENIIRKITIVEKRFPFLFLKPILYHLQNTAAEKYENWSENFVPPASFFPSCFIFSPMCYYHLIISFQQLCPLRCSRLVFCSLQKEIRKKNIFPLFFVFVFSFWFHVWIRKNFFAIYWTMLTELVRCTINNYETNWHHYLYIFYFLALISAWLEYLQKKFRENNERLQLN